MSQDGINFAGYVRSTKVWYFARIILSGLTIISTVERPTETGEWLSIPADLLSMAGTQFLSQELGKRESKFASLVNNVGAIWVKAKSKQDESTTS